jgi:hypothetical protein
VQLSQFIQDLVQQGKVTVEGEVIPFSEEDIQQSIVFLQEYYNINVNELTGTVPAFHAEAALWAARYLYRAVQLVLLRNLGNETVNDLLIAFDGEVSTETVLSVDLCFRYLGDLLALAKGLAPDDLLVKRLQEAAVQWPFSSVGMPVDIRGDINVILENDCLRRAYIDRIIEARDIKRCNNILIKEYIQEALGNYSHELWPGWEPVIKEL